MRRECPIEMKRSSAQEQRKPSHPVVRLSQYEKIGAESSRMQTNLGRWATGLCVCAALLPAGLAQLPAAPPSSPTSQPAAGGTLHGVVKSGNVPLPGVTVTAQNSLTGKRYVTTTDNSGVWLMTISQNGRYVIRAQFAAFAQGNAEVLLNASNHERTVNFDLILASRAVAQEQQAQGVAAMQAIRQMTANGPQSLNLMNALTGDEEAGSAGNATASGAALPSIASNSEFNADSVNINGHSGQVSPLAGLDMDRIRNVVEDARAMNGGGILSGGMRGGFGGGGFLGGPGGFAGGFMGGRFNFRAFNPAQPHGAAYWDGSNFSELDAEPFSLLGQRQIVPASGSNQFGLTFMTAPYIPGLTKPSGKDSIFLSLSGTRSSNPEDQYATVPTDAERSGIIPGLSTKITPVPQATALLNYIPEPNLPGDTQNFHLLTTAQSNSTQAGVRYMRSFGANARLSASAAAVEGWRRRGAAARSRARGCGRASTSTTTGRTRRRTK